MFKYHEGSDRLKKKQNNQKKKPATTKKSPQPKYLKTRVRLSITNSSVHGLESVFFIMILLDFFNLSHILSDVYTEFGGM